MTEYSRYIPVLVAAVLGIILQGVLVMADSCDTPRKVAVEFVKSYYQLDPSASELICQKLRSVEGADMARRQIQRVVKEARDRGFGPNYMKQILYHIETHTTVRNDSTAEVQLMAIRRTSINPVYALVAKIFLIGESHVVNERIHLVKEEGRWKVCDGVFPLSGGI